MAVEITSGTVYATPLGEFWMGTIWLPSTTDDGDWVNLDTLSPLITGSGTLGPKLKNVIFATANRVSSSGTSDMQACSWTSGSARIVLGLSGTFATSDIADVDGGRTTITDYRRDIFFIAKSQ